MASAREAFQRQRAVNMGAGQQRLREHLLHRRRPQEFEDDVERKGVLLAERNDDAVVGGGGLQLEIERAAEALAQRQAPGAIDARAEGRVDHELHAAAFVEEALGHHAVGRWAWRPARRGRPARRPRPVPRPGGPARTPRGQSRRTRRPSSSRSARHFARQLARAARALRRARTGCRARRRARLPRARGPLPRGGCARRWCPAERRRRPCSRRRNPRPPCPR